MGNMGVVYSLMERLRELVGSCWDYCVIWKLNEDPWSLECVDCCCGGNYQKIADEEDALFPTTTTTATGCKDVMFQHPRMRCCELLSQLPPSLPLDGINAEVLISNQPRWLKNAKISSDLSTTPTEETMESKVLIPVPGGLVEFYASKMVPEDQSLIDYVVSQCNALSLSDQTNNNNTNTMNMNGAEFPPYSPSTGLANLNLSSSADATADRIRICNSAMNFLQQFSYLTDQTPTSSNKDDDALLQGPPDDHNSNTLQHLPFAEANPSLDQPEKGSMKHDLGGRPDSGSDSDPIDDEDDPKYSRRKNGKGNQSKNLEAERKRRKKLNERLYLLRSLVPKISKLDRAAILGDAIEYVMELQKQEKDLQNELEHNSDDEGVGSSLITNPSQHQNGNIPLDYSNLIPVVNTTNNKFVDSYEHGEPSGGFYAASSSSLKRSHDDCKTTTPSTFDNKGQQMEVQVEVAHLDGNEFFIKVFGEQKRGGFVRLMEALDSLGLEITTVNVTSCISLVSYVFTVEKKDSEMVQADYLRDTLLEMTRNQSGGEWAELVKAQTQAQTQTHHQLDQFQHPSYYNHHFHPF